MVLDAHVTDGVSPRREREPDVGPDEASGLGWNSGCADLDARRVADQSFGLLDDGGDRPNCVAEGSVARRLDPQEHFHEFLGSRVETAVGDESGRYVLAIGDWDTRAFEDLREPEDSPHTPLVPDSDHGSEPPRRTPPRSGTGCESEPATT